MLPITCKCNWGLLYWKGGSIRENMVHIQFQDVLFYLWREVTIIQVILPLVTWVQSQEISTVCRLHVHIVLHQLNKNRHLGNLIGTPQNKIFQIISQPGIETQTDMECTCSVVQCSVHCNLNSVAEVYTARAVYTAHSEHFCTLVHCTYTSVYVV